MEFASSTRAAENRTRWKEIVAKSSEGPRRLSNIIGYNRIEYIVAAVQIASSNGMPGNFAIV